MKRLALILLLALPQQSCGIWMFACLESKDRPHLCDGA